MESLLFIAKTLDLTLVDSVSYLSLDDAKAALRMEQVWSTSILLLTHMLICKNVQMFQMTLQHDYLPCFCSSTIYCILSVI